MTQSLLPILLNVKDYGLVHNYLFEILINNSIHNVSPYSILNEVLPQYYYNYGKGNDGPASYTIVKPL